MSFHKQTPTEAREKSLRAMGHGATFDELRWQLLQAALDRNWEEYESIRVTLNKLGADIPPRLS